MLAQSDVSLIGGSALILGMMLLVATCFGWFAHVVRVPRVVGYLLGGILLRLFLLWIGSPETSLETLDTVAGSAADVQEGHEPALIQSAALLDPIKSLALGLILFAIGGVFETRRLRAAGSNVVRLALSEALATAVLVSLAVAAAVFFTEGGALPAGTILCFAFLLGLAGQATAPAATLFVLREYEAKGTTTDAVLSMVGINNVVCIVAFHAAFYLMAATGALGESTAIQPHMFWWSLMGLIGGSLLVGLVVGVLITIVHVKVGPQETVAVLLGILLLLGAGEQWLLDAGYPSYNFLLTTICMGAVFTNVGTDPERLSNRIRVVAAPLLVAFFILAGFELHMDELLKLGWVGIAYVGARLAGKMLGGWWGVRWGARAAEGQRQIGGNIGAAMLCQAAVVIGLAQFVDRHWADPWARGRFITVALGSVAIFEMIGPLLIKWVVVRAGEVKAVTLLRRSDPSAMVEKRSVLKLVIDSTRRALGMGRAKAKDKIEDLQVRHLMRANVKCLDSASDLREVLRFVEQAHYNEFPVINTHGHFVGLIRYQDIREMMYDPMLIQLLTALDLVDTNCPVVPMDMSLDDALVLFQEKDVGLLPVVEQAGARQVVGMVEQRDLLRVLHETQASS